MSFFIVVVVFIVAAVWGKLSRYVFYEVTNPTGFILKFKNYVAKSWRNKYKSPSRKAPNNWYYKYFNIAYEEKFPLSATVLVVLTDWFHAIQFITTKVIFLLLATNWIMFFILWGAWSLGFNLIYNKWIRVL